MGKLDPLAGPGKDYPVLSYDIAATQCGKADIALAPRPGLAVAGAHPSVIQRNAAGLGGSLSE